MLALSLIATSLVATAALLSMTTRPAPALRTSGGGGNQRGITLQTLIVTAVLVLMAVAAGVVIVAITRSAQDDLENQTSTIGAKCNEVEVYDARLAAANVPGTNLGGAVEGSDIGCVPACTLVFPDTFGGTQAELANFKLELNTNLTPEEAVVMHIDDIDQFYEPSTRPDFLNNLSSVYTSPISGTKVKGRAWLYETSTAVRLYLTTGIWPRSGDPPLKHSEFISSSHLNSDVVGIRVAPNQRQCHAYDVTGEIVPLFNF